MEETEKCEFIYFMATLDLSYSPKLQCSFDENCLGIIN